MLYTFDHYVLDTALFELRFRGERRPLQRKPLDLLHYLVQHRERVVLKSELLSHLWPGVCVTDNALVQAVACVRDAMPEQRGAIVSVRGRGYRFALAVKEEASSPPPSGWSIPQSLLARGGFVLDVRAATLLKAAIGRAEEEGALVTRSEVVGGGVLEAFRAALKAHVGTIERAGDHERAAALARAVHAAQNDRALADVVWSLANEPAARPMAIVIEHLERADLASVCLFALLASQGALPLVGTVAFGDLAPSSAVRKILAALDFTGRTNLLSAPVRFGDPSVSGGA